MTPTKPERRPSSPTARGSRWLALVAALAAWSGGGASGLPAAPPQEPAPKREAAPPWEAWTAPDGSRFVLVPDTAWFGPPVVHWVTLVPTDPADEPVGAEGLARAIVRASLDGSAGTGSLDGIHESEALERLDQIERKVIAALQRGEQPPETELRTTRAATAALGVQDAWRRSLARAGVNDLELRELDGASLIHLAMPTESLRDVAVLVRERREQPLLRDLRRSFDAVRAELRLDSAAAAGRMQREILGAAFPGIASARPLAVHPRVWTRGEALALFATIHHPSRGLHVLTGAFDPTRVRELLKLVFADTQLPPVATPPAPAPAEARNRRAVLQSDGATGLAIAWPQPKGPPELQLAVLEWLAGGRTSRLAGGLRGAGLGEVELSYRFPFPAQARPGVLLLQVIAEPGNPKNDRLEALVNELLQSAATNGPTPNELVRIRARLRQRMTGWTNGTRDAAFVIAAQVGLEGRDPALLFREPPEPTREAMLAIAQELEGAPRTVVALQVSR